jgi:hypothetical protein
MTAIRTTWTLHLATARSDDTRPGAITAQQEHVAAAIRGELVLPTLEFDLLQLRPRLDPGHSHFSDHPGLLFADLECLRLRQLLPCSTVRLVGRVSEHDDEVLLAERLPNLEVALAVGQQHVDVAVTAELRPDGLPEGVAHHLTGQRRVVLVLDLGGGSQ